LHMANGTADQVLHNYGKLVTISPDTGHTTHSSMELSPFEVH
jgi:hypothetical protein